MYFNPQVKENKSDFFNFEMLQEELRNALGNKLAPFIAVYGLRRTGKTSLIKVVLNSLRKKYIWIDSRDISSKDDLYDKLLKEVHKLKRFKIERISIKGVELSLSFFKKRLDYLNTHKLILVIDEAQLLKRLHLDKTLAFIYDNYPRIKVVLSGSEVGMLLDFLGKSSARAPLYGRAVFEIQTQRLNKEDAYLFLGQGAKQVKILLKEEEIRTAIEKLDGIIGWLTKYGWYRLRFSHKEALRKTIEEGKYIAEEEFQRFAVRAEKKYKAIIKSIKGGARWEEIKQQTSISDKQLYLMLKRLMGCGFVEKQNRIYTIADPLLEAAI